MKNIKVCAVVVTFNRLELLKQQINSILIEQDFKIDKYYIVDNCSSDGTEEFFKSINNSKVEYLKTSSNIGGAGGFCYGLQRAFESGFDWYILMDDDGKPMRRDCFKNMVSHICLKGYDSEKLFLLNSIVQSDEIFLSFGLGHVDSVEEIEKLVIENEIKDRVNPFNGTWISNGLIKEIGFPNGKFFIKGDENDYTIRAYRANAHVATIRDSVYFHPKITNYSKKIVLGKEMYVYVEAPWKEYYNVRNHVYSYKSNHEIKKSLVYVIKRMYCVFACDCEKAETLKQIVLGMYDGIMGKLGKKE